MSSVTQSHSSSRQIEATMIQGANVNIGHANLNMTNQQISEATQERRFALDSLRSNCSLAAVVDANERYNPPRCAEETRSNIMRRMEDWVRHNDNPHCTSSGIFWLYGGAGAGKSALAQTLAEKLKTTGELAASFFFFKTDTKRNDGDRLISTLVYQLLQSYQGLSPIVEEKILRNPDLFKKKRQTQMSELLVEPLIRLSLQETNGDQSNTARPQLVVIDGLDECIDPEIQCDLLQIIANAIPRLPYPLRFLITSRPESHISRVFEHDLREATQYNLSDDLDADKDIRYFLDGEFAEIRRTHPLRRYLPSTWPPQDAIHPIVERSSGHFIFASTVIRFIQSPHHRPDDRLQVILGIKQPYGKDQPYAPLDSLYRFIFLEIQDPDRLERIYRAFGIMHLRTLKRGIFDMPWGHPSRSRWTSNIDAIEVLLELRPGDLILLFDQLLSLVTFEKDDIRIFHKSLFDYLLDSSRSRDLQLDLGLAHENVANYILKWKNIQGDWVSEWDFQIFLYHCQFGRLNKTLTSHLRSLAYNPKVSSTNSWPRVFGQSESLQSILYFLRVIGRQDFDSSGHCYRTYLKKKTQCLKLAVSLRQQLRSVTNAARPEVIRLSTSAKGFLNSSLGIFNQNVATFGLEDVQQKDKNRPKGRTAIPAINSSIVKAIEQEHEMFSSYVKDLHQYPAIVFSFLETNKPFIHSCHLVIREGLSLHVSFVTLVTYTEHGVRLSSSEYFNLSGYIEMKKLVEKHFQVSAETQKGADNDYTRVSSISEKGGSLMGLTTTRGRF